MTKYLVRIPITAEMSPITYTVRDSSYQTKAQDALWHYNKSREHDGLDHVKRLPKGTKYERLTT